MRRFMERLSIFVLISLALVTLPPGEIQADGADCVDQRDRGNTSPWDATTEDGREKLYPYDTASCQYREQSYGHDDSGDIFPVWNTRLRWYFDVLNVADSKFEILENGTRIICYDIAEVTADCITVQQSSSIYEEKELEKVMTRPNAVYRLKRYISGILDDAFKKGVVVYWEGRDLDPRNDVCRDAKAPGSVDDNKIQFKGDQDWWLQEITAPSTLDVLLQVPANYELEVWKDCSTVLARSNKSGSEPERITRSVDPGKYQIHVYGATPEVTSDNPYYLTMTATSLDTTAPVTTPTLHNGKLHDGSNEDPVQPDPRGKSWYNAGSWLELQASDAGSGVAGTWWQIDDPTCSPAALSKCETLNVSPGWFTTGTHTIYYFSQDKAGIFETRKTIGPFNVDASIPSCEVEWSSNAQGQTTALKITTQDTDSGVKLIEIPKCDNCQLPVSIPPIGKENTSPIVVQITKTVPANSAVVVLEITDVAVNTTRCTPVDLVAGSNAAKPATVTMSAVPQAQSKLRIQNGKPGLNNLRVTVNGKTFKVDGLKERETRTLNVSSAMQPGNKNTITLTGQGKKGGSASVLILNGK